MAALFFVRRANARRLVGPAAAAVLLHVALLGGWRLRPVPPVPPAVGRIAIVAVVPHTTVEAPVASPARPMAAPAPRAALGSSTRPVLRSTPSAGRASADADAAPAAPLGAAVAAAASAVPTVRPLDLAVRPGGAAIGPARNPVLDDPRANTARAAPEARMAQRLSQVVHEELREDGSVRIRRGDDCVDLKPTRAAGLFAAEGATHPLPRLASACP